MGDADKSGNAPAGTVVDRDVTHPGETPLLIWMSSLHLRAYTDKSRDGV